MTAEIQVTFDAHDPRRLGLFWREVLDYAVDPPPGGTIGDPVETADAWLDFLTKAGVPQALHNSAFGIVDPDGNGPRIFFQQVPEDKVTKNRVHLDVRAAPGLAGDARMTALEAECERVVALGAVRGKRFEPDGGMSAGFIVMTDPEGIDAIALPKPGIPQAGHITMLDPEGNEFCLD